MRKTVLHTFPIWKICSAMRNLLMLLFIAFIFQPSFGQTRNEYTMVEASSNQSQKAIRAFNNGAYPRAINIFENLAEKNKLNNEEKGLMAIAFFRINEPVRAAEIFSNIGEEFIPGRFLYSYARVLQELGQYRSADRIMLRYSKEFPTDSRAQEQVNTFEFVKNTTSTNRYSITPVIFNSAYADFSPLIQNGIMYFTSDRPLGSAIKRKTARNHQPYLNIFRAVPRGDGFSSPQLFLNQFKTIFHDGPLCFNTTGTEIFLTRNKFHSVLKQEGSDNYNRLKIVHSTRTPEGNWTEPQELSFNEPGSSSGHPWLTYDNNRLYFASDRPGGYGKSDIWYVNRSKDGWETPVNAGPEINTEGNEMFPYISSTGDFYFASDGHMGMGGLDLFIARNIEGKYLIKNMGHPINSEKDDFSIFINPDEKTGFFASNRPGGEGHDDIYSFSILKPISFEQEKTAQKDTLPDHYKIKVIDQKSQVPVPGVIVGFLNSEGRYLGEATSDQEGFLLLNSSLKGSITAMAAVEYYYPYEETIELENTEDSYFMMLRPMPAYGIYGQITRSDNGSPIPGVKISVANLSNETKTYTSDQEGKFRIRLAPYSSFKIEFTKDGFNAIQTDYSTINKENGYINLNQTEDLKMKPDD